MVGSAMFQICNFSFKTFFQIHAFYFQSLFNWVVDNFDMNKRFIVVGVALGIIVVLAVIIGSPALGGFDAMR